MMFYFLQSILILTLMAVIYGLCVYLKRNMKPSKHGDEQHDVLLDYPDFKNELGGKVERIEGTNQFKWTSTYKNEKKES